MMISEEVAKTKWCPLAVVIVRDMYSGAAGNRSNDKNTGLLTGARCLGSRCMAWRWEIYNGAEAVHQAGDCGFCGMATGAGG